MSDLCNRSVDKNTSLGAHALLNYVTVNFLWAALLWAGSTAGEENVARDLWAANVQHNIQRITHSGELGVYIKDMRSGAVVSVRGDEPWYLASGVKVPVAVTLLQQVEKGTLSLDSTLRLAETDYVDGAGRTNRYRPGSQLSVRFLLEQMLIYSDNTASDMLIRLVGLDAVNAMLEDQVPQGFGKVTTLADVRRSIYSGFHPQAASLKGRDFLRIRAQPDHRRIGELAKVIAVPVEQFSLNSIDGAYDAYYATHLNTGSLAAYAAFLEAILRGQFLQPDTNTYLLDLLAHVKTGARRIKAGLPASVTFAHKTGTQHRRICDLGIASGPASTATENATLLIAACTRDFSSLAEAENALRQVGEILTQSGVWSTEPVAQPNLNTVEGDSRD
jgi:beta-lactamase class A